MGKFHYFDWAIFNSYVTNYQRVTLLYVLHIEPRKDTEKNTSL